MRVVSLHPDVLVATSAIWQTNCVVVRGAGGAGAGGAGSARAEAETGGEGVADGQGHVTDESAGIRGDQAGETFVIDSPILPDELDALGALIGQAGFPDASGLLATHGDWDHLLGRLAFGDLALGCAESTAARMQASPGAAQRELREFDRRFYVERPRPLMLGQVQALPVPGRCGIGAHELELHPAGGHTVDGMAVWIPWARVLVAGDYLSTVEPPEVGEDSSAEAYVATLERLRPLVRQAEHVVPGHGPVLDSRHALGLLDEHVTALTI
jgi:glyoxylase-like metal-dependent hydrolase (beta-lactamase superfamily II)